MIPPQGLAYLATPYTKYPRGLHAAFVDAAATAAKLLRAGVKIYSPMCHGHPLAMYGGLDPLDLAIWLPLDDAMLAVCDVLIVAHMEGWQESQGIAHEIKFFEQARKPIYDLKLEPFCLVRREISRPPHERYDGASDAELRGKAEEYLAHGKTPSEQGGASV